MEERGHLFGRKQTKFVPKTPLPEVGIVELARKCLLRQKTMDDFIIKCHALPVQTFIRKNPWEIVPFAFRLDPKIALQTLIVMLELIEKGLDAAIADIVVVNFFGGDI